MPEQQRAAQEAERRKSREAQLQSGANRFGGRAARGAWGDSAAHGGPDPSKAALRELSRRGVLEREDVQAMLRPCPLQDFRGSVLQVGNVPYSPWAF